MLDKKKKVRGLTLLEMIAVIVIIVILLIGMGMSYVNNVKKANRDQTVNTLSVFSNNLGDAYYDLGMPSFEPGIDDEAFKTFLHKLEDNYVGCKFDMDNITATTYGYCVDILTPETVYETKFRCWFTTTETMKKVIMVACSGADGIFEDATYKDKNYGDDMVLVVYPKGDS